MRWVNKMHQNGALNATDDNLRFALRLFSFEPHHVWRTLFGSWPQELPLIIVMAPYLSFKNLHGARPSTRFALRQQRVADGMPAPEHERARLGNHMPSIC